MPRTARKAPGGMVFHVLNRGVGTHVRRWQAHYHEVGHGHLYQGRFKSFPVQENGHFLTVARYVERNAPRARQVQRAEIWRWSSLWQRVQGSAKERAMLSDWPVARPADWVNYVNEPQTDAELAELRLSISKGRPFGAAEWQREMASRLGLRSCFAVPGRPRNPATPELS